MPIVNYTQDCSLHALTIVIGNDELLIAAARCLVLLLIPTKTKEESRDIPFFMKFVPVSVHYHQLIILL